MRFKGEWINTTSDPIGQDLISQVKNAFRLLYLPSVQGEVLESLNGVCFSFLVLAMRDIMQDSEDGISVVIYHGRSAGSCHGGMLSQPLA